MYIPKIYGFRVSERAKCGPRMQWMRARPENAEELDLVDWRGRWIDDDDQYDDDEGHVDEDRPMEDFDPVRTTARFPLGRSDSRSRLHRMHRMTTMTKRRKKRRRVAIRP